MGGDGVLMKARDWLTVHSPFWLQYFYMERVVRVVQASLRKEDEVLLQEKEGRLRRWRQHRPFAVVRNPQLDLLDLSKAYQQAFEKTASLRSNG